MQLCANKPPAQALGAVCAISHTSDMFQVPLRLPTAVSLPRTEARTLGAELAPGHRGWAKLQIAQAVIYGSVSKQSCRFTVSCHLQVRFRAFNEFDPEFGNPFDAQIQSEFESEK